MKGVGLVLLLRFSFGVFIVLRGSYVLYVDYLLFFRVGVIYSI